MKKPEPVYFNMHGVDLPADGILAVVQKDENDVSVRYAGKTLTIHNTSVEKVTAAIDAAKSKRR